MAHQLSGYGAHLPLQLTVFQRTTRNSPVKMLGFWHTAIPHLLWAGGSLAQESRLLTRDVGALCARSPTLSQEHLASQS